MDDDLLPSFRVRKIDFALAALQGARAFLDSTSETLGTFITLVGGHANYQSDRDEFMNSAREEIESLTGDEQEPED